MTDPALNPQWTPPPPPLSGYAPGQDPASRKRRMRLGYIGAGVGLGVFLLAVAIVVIYAALDGSSGTTDVETRALLLLAVEVLLAPTMIILGIVLAAVPATRPFGVGFLIGSAIGIIIAAGVCFGQAMIPQSTTY